MKGQNSITSHMYNLLEDLMFEFEKYSDKEIQKMIDESIEFSDKMGLSSPLRNHIRRFIHKADTELNQREQWRHGLIYPCELTEYAKENYEIH